MKHKIIIELEQATDRTGLYDVVNIKDEEREIESCNVVGLIGCKMLTVGSWIRKRELNHSVGIKGKNPHLKFVLSGSSHGCLQTD